MEAQRVTTLAYTCRSSLLSSRAICALQKRSAKRRKNPKQKKPNLINQLKMDGGASGAIGSEVDREEDEAANEILRDRFRLCTVSIAEAEAKQYGMEISQPIMTCVSDLAFKYAEQLAKDLELFAQHAGRKCVNMEDVVLAAHRNGELAASLRSFCNDLNAKEPPPERKRKKNVRKSDKGVTEVDVVYVPDL